MAITHFVWLHILAKKNSGDSKMADNTTMWVIIAVVVVVVLVVMNCHHKRPEKYNQLNPYDPTCSIACGGIGSACDCAHCTCGKSSRPGYAACMSRNGCPVSSSDVVSHRSRGHKHHKSNANDDGAQSMPPSCNAICSNPASGCACTWCVCGAEFPRGSDEYNACVGDWC